MANKPKLGVAGLFLAAGIGLSGCQNSPPPRPFGSTNGVGGQRVVQDQKSGPNVTQNNRVLNAGGQPGTGSPYGLQPNQPAPGAGGQINTTGNFRPDSPPGGDLNLRQPLNGGGIHHVTGDQPGSMSMQNPPVEQRRLDAPLTSPAPGQFGGDGLNSSQPLVSPPPRPQMNTYPAPAPAPAPGQFGTPPAPAPLPLPGPDVR